MCNLFVKKFLKLGQTKLNTVHRVKTEHTGKVWEARNSLEKYSLPNGCTWRQSPLEAEPERDHNQTGLL